VKVVSSQNDNLRPDNPKIKQKPTEGWLSVKSLEYQTICKSKKLCSLEYCEHKQLTDWMIAIGNTSWVCDPRLMVYALKWAETLKSWVKRVLHNFAYTPLYGIWFGSWRSA